MAKWGTIVGPGGFQRYLTDADVIWTVRMLDGEASTDPSKIVEWEATLWTMANRWASCRYLCPAGETYTGFIRRFSKAINPRWWPEQGMNPRLNHPLSWYESRFPEVVIVAQRFLTGKIPNRFVGWTNYGAPTDPGVVSGSVRVVAPGMPSEHVNWFYIEPWAKNWTGDTVKIVAPDSPRKAGFGLLAALLVVGTAVGMLWRR